MLCRVCLRRCIAALRTRSHWACPPPGPAGPAGPARPSGALARPAGALGRPGQPRVLLRLASVGELGAAVGRDVCPVVVVARLHRPAGRSRAGPQPLVDVGHLACRLCSRRSRPGRPNADRASRWPAPAPGLGACTCRSCRPGSAAPSGRPARRSRARGRA